MSFTGPRGPIGGTELDILDGVSTEIQSALHGEKTCDRDGNEFFFVEKYALRQAIWLLQNYRAVIIKNGCESGG